MPYRSKSQKSNITKELYEKNVSNAQRVYVDYQICLPICTPLAINCQHFIDDHGTYTRWYLDTCCTRLN